MKKILLFLPVLLFSFFTKEKTEREPLIIKKKTQSSLNIITANVCSQYGYLVVNNGDSGVTSLPTLGYVDAFSSTYTSYDTLRNTQRILDFELAPLSPPPTFAKYAYAASENKVFSFHVWNYGPPFSIVPGDTLYKDSIACIEATADKFILARKTSGTANFFAYDTALSGQLFSLQLNMTPVLMATDDNTMVYVVGKDPSNQTRLNIIDLNSQVVVTDTLLGAMASDPVDMKYYYPDILIAAEPGDSVVSVVKYSGGTISYNTIYHQSGINCAEWVDGNLHFQPDTDTSASLLNKQVIKYNPLTQTVTNTFLINKRLSVLEHPVNSGYEFYSYVHLVKKQTGNVNWFYVYDNFTYSFIDSIQVGINPEFFMNDWRCPVSVKEYDDSKVELKVYPSPATENANITISGLICGRSYKMDIADMNGKVVFEKTIAAKQALSVPVSHFSPGIYFIRVHTLRGLITQKIIVE